MAFREVVPVTLPSNPELQMRTAALTAFALTALLAGCSKPEPAAGAPTPTVVTIDSAKTVKDSTVSTVKDSTVKDSTMSWMADTAAVVADTTPKN